MPSRPSPSFGVLTLAFAAVHTIAMVMASWFVTPEGASLWFPPAAIVLTYLVTTGVRGALPAIAVRIAGSYIAPWAASLEVRVLSSLVVVAVYLAAALLVRRAGALDSSSRTPLAALGHVLLLGASAPLLAAAGTVGLIELVSSGSIDGVLGGIPAFAIGDGVAVLTLTPALLRLARRQRLNQSRHIVAVAAPTLVASALVGAAVILLHGAGVPLHLLAIPLTVAAVWGGSDWFAYTLAGTALVSTTAIRLADASTAIDAGELQLLLWTLGATGLVVAAASDERRRVTDELRRSTQQSDVTFDRSLTPTLVIDAETGRTLRANDAMAELLDLGPEDLVGTAAASLFVSEVPHALDALVERPVTADVRVHGAAPRVGRFTSTPLPASEPTETGVVIAQFLDMTDVRAREEALQRSNESLAAFAHRVGQDLREPLDTILGFSRLLGRAQPMPDDVREDILGRMVAGAAEAVRQIDDLLETARSLAERPTPVCLDELSGWLHAATAVLLAESGGTLEVRLQRGRPLLPLRTLRQVLLQLVDNGIRHAAPGLAPHVLVTSSHVNDGILFRVEDVGTGIPTDDIEAVFHPSAGGGSGLVTCRRLAEAQGGKLLAVPSRTGSCLVLHLPVAPERSTASDGPSSDPATVEPPEALSATPPRDAVYG